MSASPSYFFCFLFPFFFFFFFLFFSILRQKRLRDDNGGVLVAVDGDVSRFELESKRVRSEEPLSRRDECPKRRDEARSFDVCSALPLDVAWLLAGFLDPRSLFRCCLVSLAWLDIFGSDAVWRAQFSSVFPCRSGFARRLEGPRVMSLFAARCRLETLFSPRSFDCGALARRGAEACEVGRETIEQVMRLAEAEGRLRCVECCSSMEFLPRVAAAVAEQARWRDRSARAVAGSTEFVRSLMSSVRFWKSERRESRFFPAGPDFSQEFLFSFSLRGILYTCAFFESDSEDDRDFPQFTVTNAVTSGLGVVDAVSARLVDRRVRFAPVATV